MRINKSIFRYIEHELYNYEQTKKDLQLYREQVLEGTPRPDVSSQTGPSDITQSKAVKLTSSAFVIQSERILNAIDKSLTILEIGTKNYQTKISTRSIFWPNITIDMGISDRTYYRLRRELVTEAASD